MTTVPFWILFEELGQQYGAALEFGTMQFGNREIRVEANELLSHAASVVLIAMHGHFEFLFKFSAREHALEMLQFEYVIEAIWRSSAMVEAIAHQIEILPQIDDFGEPSHAC